MAGKAKQPAPGIMDVVRLPRGGGLRAATLGVFLALAGSTTLAESASAQSYWAYVAAESDDEVALVRYDAGGDLVVEKTIIAGWLPAEIEAPHGLFVEPSGRHWYLTLGHGYPNGQLVKYETGSDTVVGVTELGLFPATIAIPPYGGLALAVNANFHGDHVPSTVSIIDLETMESLGDETTCTMPHGSRFNRDGTKHYSACMMDNQLVEIDAATLAVSRRLDLMRNVAVGETMAHQGMEHQGMAHQARGETMDAGMDTCSPTWATPHPTEERVYVPCNKGDVILEVDLGDWSIARRIDAPGAPYNLDVSPDGRLLLGTLKGGASVGVWSVASGDLLHSIPTTQKVAHGVVITPDSRYAFVTVEGIGGDPGVVEVLDLEAGRRVASVEMGKQAGGVAFWKMESP